MSINCSDEYEYRQVRGHIEVYKDNKFVFSADSYKEAVEEIMESNVCFVVGSSE